MPCPRPETTLTFEILSSLTEVERLLFIRGTYCNIAACLQAEIDGGEDDTEILDRASHTRSVCENMQMLLIDFNDGVLTDDAELMSTHLGTLRDELATTTRRSYPLGTILADLDGWLDGIEVTATTNIAVFRLSPTTERIITEPSYADIMYEASIRTEDRDVEVEERELLDFEEKSDTFELDDKESCIKEPCTFKPEIDVDLELEQEPIVELDADSGLTNDDLTTLFEDLMCKVDGSIHSQYAQLRLDSKTFGEMYGGAISSTLQAAVSFVTQKAKLDLEAKRLQLEQNKGRYETALAKARIEAELLKIEIAKAKLPLEMAKLGQEAKLTERQVIHTRRQIEQTKASTRATYDTMAEGRKTGEVDRERIEANIEKIYKDTDELTANGLKDRQFTSARTQNTRVDTAVKKEQSKLTSADIALKKAQTHKTDSSRREERENGASNRRVNNAEVQTKNKIASLYNEQRKSMVRTHREKVLNIGVNAWATQLENLGGENMVIEGVKGAELSSRMERAFLDAGL